MRLEMALQYSFFDNQTNTRRNIMVTPIQETPSLTLSESDMQVTQEPVNENGEDANRNIEDPLIHRLKESEIEASDNVSTSNDELPSESNDNWPDYVNDPLRCYREDDDETDRSRNSLEVRSAAYDQFRNVPLPVCMFDIV